jgi:hypothetical protein
MKQSRIVSLIEALLSTAAGFGLSVAAQALFLPLLGLPISLKQNLAFAVIMTVISIGRQFVLRRIFEALHIRRPLSPAMAAIIAERVRQIEVEGWSAVHDASHAAGEMALAGASYALAAAARVRGQRDLSEPPACWPWERAWWKPQNFRRDLVRAGALFVAELEKFDRAKSRGAKR